MILLDTFTGIGGFSLAFKEVFPEGKIIGYSEIDKYASKVYEKHFPGVKALGDITAIRERELPEFDILTFGFPCQDLSIAGKRAGFQGKRSILFFEAIRIINAVRPKYFIFENVKGLFSSHGGRDFTAILRSIADIGYDGQWQLLNTKWFLPQNRERIYFVGHLRGEPRPEIFPITENDFINNEKAIWETENIAGCINTKNNSPNWQFDASTTLISNSAKTRKWEIRKNNIITPLRANSGAGHNNLVQIGTIGKDSEATRIYDSEGISRTIKNGGGLGAKTGLYMVQRPRGFNKGGQRKLPCLTDNNYHQNNFLGGIRRLTPMECERLQGFPDRWTEGISDTQRYKCLGNAISVPVAVEIFKKLKQSIDLKNKLT